MALTNQTDSLGKDAQLRDIRREPSTVTLADDETCPLGTAVDGVYLVVSNGKSGIFSVAGSTTTVTGDAEMAAADTDTKTCLYVTGGVLTLKNRLGSSKTLKIRRLV